MNYQARAQKMIFSSQIDFGVLHRIFQRHHRELNPDRILSEASNPSSIVQPAFDIM